MLNYWEIVSITDFSVSVDAYYTNYVNQTLVEFKILLVFIPNMGWQCWNENICWITDKYSEFEDIERMLSEIEKIWFPYKPKENLFVSTFSDFLEKVENNSYFLNYFEFIKAFNAYDFGQSYKKLNQVYQLIS